MTKHRFNTFGMIAAATITGVCLSQEADWPVVLVWAAITIYFYSEVHQKDTP